MNCFMVSLSPLSTRETKMSLVGGCWAPLRSVDVFFALPMTLFLACLRGTTLVQAPFACCGVWRSGVEGACCQVLFTDGLWRGVVTFASQPEDEKGCSDVMASFLEVTRIYSPEPGW